MARLLDIFWLLLFAPSFCVWMWRRPDLTRGRFIITVTCFLVLLFPVISANDDLRAAAQDVEEPGPSKNSVKQVSGAKHLTHTASGPAFVHPELKLSYPAHAGNLDRLNSQHNVLVRSSDTFSSRAPPSSRG